MIGYFLCDPLPLLVFAPSYVILAPSYVISALSDVILALSYMIFTTSYFDLGSFLRDLGPLYLSRNANLTFLSCLELAIGLT